MHVRLLTTAQDHLQYDQWIKAHPQGNLWQSLERKRYIEAVGKEARIYVAENNGGIAASALVMIDRTLFGLSTWEIPRGPILQQSDDRIQTEGTLLTSIIADAKRDKCMALFLSPAVHLSSDFCHLSPSARNVHCAATRIIDLTPSEEEILAQMKPKGRYNIRVAEKHGIRIEESGDIDAFYALVRETARRDGFIPQSKEKYRAFLEQLPGSFLLIASSQSPIPNPQSPIIAALLGVIWNNMGIYYYGASSHEHRALMAPYALQWAAMRRCKAAGCTSYDLLGVAPHGAAENHPWQGITRFKEHFGGTLVTYPPEQEMVLRPVMKYAIDLKRRFFR